MSRPGRGVAMESRFCVSCGRSIEFDANACPYCGYDFRPVLDVAYDPIGTNMRILYYLLSFFIGLAGIIIGAIYMAKPDPEHQHVGKICLIMGIFSTFITPIVLAAFLYILVLGI
jgi:hypothetical protein